MTHIVAFAGRKQSGKTTCANHIRYVASTLYPEGTEVGIYNFADPLKKDICINILGLTAEQCYGSDDNKNSVTHIEWEGRKLTAREVMQIVGTDIFRNMYNNVWVNATINKILREQPKLAIIADCRFPNEVEAVQDAGGMVVKLNRNPHNSDHPSETALDAANYSPNHFDLVVYNGSMSIEDQNNLITKFLQKKGILPF